MEFDSQLGGDQELPDAVNMLKFAAARSREIETIKNSLKPNKVNKLAFQKLPTHMRRRVMSHNAKRLPRRLREIHLSQLKKSGMPPKQKRPSRKYRRRPSNLAVEFARRKNNTHWLETHIWHAKRFHMVNKWGWRLPHRPCDKAFRACYRASSKHCLLQDISYYSCIELNGAKDELIDTLKKITTKDGLSFGARAFINGNREGSTTFIDQKKVVGEIYFNWRGADNEKECTLWIWVHAAYYESVLNLLTTSFQTQRVTIIELKDDLNRFRLTGPLSQSVLRQALKPVNHLNNAEWLKTYLQNDEYRQMFAEQIDYWEKIKLAESPSLLPPHLVLSLIINDPRYTFPMKRTKAVIEKSEKPEEDFRIVDNISDGAIWIQNIRTEVSKSKMSNAAISDLRSNLLVPGTELEQPGQPVPIMLVQRPGKEQSGYNSGWDIIIPSGWAQPMWMCLIMWGARAGGLRETDSTGFEFGRPSFLAPDTPAGAKEDTELHEVSLNKYFKKPPNKRTNYNAFSIVSPFNYNWNVLIDNWNGKNGNKSDFFVERNFRKLSALQEALQSKNRVNILKALDIEDNSLIPVRLVTEKGTFNTYSIICLPTLADLKCKCDPVEPKTIDINFSERKHLRKSHATLLQRLKRKRHAARKLGKQLTIDLDILKTYQAKMRELWIKSEVTDIRNSCSREIMGFVTKGGFSFCLGKTSAVGYIASGALKLLLQNSFGNKVLLRSTTSRQYRYATIDIIK